MPIPEAITYIDGTGNPQAIEPRKMSSWERARADTLLLVGRLLTKFVYPHPHQAETVKTELWLFSYYPRERIGDYLALAKSRGLRVRSTREIQDRIPREESAVTLQHSTGAAVGSLFPQFISEPVSP